MAAAPNHRGAAIGHYIQQKGNIIITDTEKLQLCNFTNLFEVIKTSLHLAQSPKNI